MNYRTIIIINILLTLVSCRDNRESYAIGTGNWYFETPEGFVWRDDHFEKSLEMNAATYEELGYPIAENQKTIVAISKSLDNDYDLLYASTKGAEYIEIKGLDVYAKKVKTNIDNVCIRRGDIFESSMKEIEIDGIPFFVIEREFTDSSGNPLGGTVYYMSVVFKQELDIRISFTNPNDRKKLVEAVQNSKFEW